MTSSQINVFIDELFYLYNYENRLATFHNWPTSKAQKPEDLDKVGFYYTEQEDKVICHICKLGLGKWQQSDNVLKEHATYSPKCPYVCICVNK